MATLSEQLQQKQNIELMLIDSGGELTPEIEEALALNEQNMAAKIDGYHAVMTRLDFGNETIDAEIKRLQALKRAKTNAVKRLREHLLKMMQDFNILSIEGTLCKVFRKGTSAALVVNDEMSLLGRFNFDLEEVRKAHQWPDWVKVDISIDKSLMKAAIAGGQTISGASLEKSETIQFK